jgi:D-3-phosphoglycerate dehydrogenase
MSGKADSKAASSSAGSTGPKTRILVTDGIGQEGIDLLKTHPAFELEIRASTSAKELLAIGNAYDAWIVRTPTKVGREVIEKSPRLKLVVCLGAGFDNVDVPAARERGVAVMNCPQANSLSAAEHTIALMFALARHIPRSHASLRSGAWERGEPFLGTELHGKILGVVGLGNVGRIVAEKAMALGMMVIGHDIAIHSTSSLPPKFKYLEMRFKLTDSLDEVLRESDWVTMHIPKNERNLGLFDAAAIAKMRKGSYLLNVSRGGIVVEKDLLSALESGHLSGAASDVFVDEPPRADDETVRKLLALPNFVATAHLGGATAEARSRVASTAAQQTLAFFNDGAKIGVLN